ncbi:MAG: hypothetical protein ABIN55_08970 [Aeromicrobium sp.]
MILNRGLISAALVAVVTLSGCGGSDKKTDQPVAEKPLTEIGFGCITKDDATLIHHKKDGLEANVAVMGEGDVGVVITYETFRNVCLWLPLAERLVADGYQVLLYDQLAGTGDELIPQMSDLIRDKGATKVVLVGGSQGGGESILAAPDVKPAVSAVVVMAPSDIATAEALTMPLLQVVASGDGDFPSIALANDKAATKSPDHQVITVGGIAHASKIFDGGAKRKVLDAMSAFIAKHTD